MPAIRFGEFELDEQTFKLRRKGSPARIQQQPARILAFLLPHPGVLATRDQIQPAIGGHDTFVDFEQSLNFCIGQIRLTLNDRAEQPMYIETLPRLAYRLIAPVEKAGDRKTEVERHRIRIGIAPIEQFGGAAEDYFAAGLTEDMTSALSRIDPTRLRVISVPRLSGPEALAEQLDKLEWELALDDLLRCTVRRRRTSSPMCLKACQMRSSRGDRSLAEVIGRGISEAG